MAVFQELNSKGKTIVFVTHEPDIARLISRNVIFRDGHILKEVQIKEHLDALEVLGSIPVNDEFN
jgi:putative ABC transport system ATP-binding protein